MKRPEAVRPTALAVKPMERRAVKLGVRPRFRLPDLPGERLASRRYTDICLDTSDHRLAAAGVTLRRRVEGRRGRWQLELPRALVEQPGARPARVRGGGAGALDTPPADLVALTVAAVRGATLVPVVTLRSREEGVLVSDARGPVARVVLESVQAREGGRAVGRFREIAIESLGGDEAILADLERMLRSAGAIDADGRPKLLRALGVDAAPAAPLSVVTSPAERLRAAVEEQFRLIVAHDPLTRLGTDPEELHQMRVACRRLRALLRAARPMLDPAWAEPLRAELAWLGDALGGVRDLDVLREHFGAEAARLDQIDTRAGARLIRVLEAERARVRSDLFVSLRSDRYLQLLLALEDAAGKAHVTDAVVSLEAMARAAFKTLRRAGRRLGEEPSDEALHDLRIKTKRARYAAELVAPAVGKPARRFIARAKSFQDALGEYHDAVVAQARVRGLAAQARGAATAFVAGRLLERQIARRAEILGQIPRRWRKLEKRGTRAWR